MSSRMRAPEGLRREDERAAFHDPCRPMGLDARGMGVCSGNQRSDELEHAIQVGP